MTEVKISDFLKMLEEGKTNKEIQEHYGLTTSAMVELRKHPKLKGVRSKSKPSFVIIDDTENNDGIPELDTNPNVESGNEVETPTSSESKWEYGEEKGEESN